MHSPGEVNLNLILHPGGGKNGSSVSWNGLKSPTWSQTSGLESSAVLSVLVDSYCVCHLGQVDSSLTQSSKISSCRLACPTASNILCKQIWDYYSIQCVGQVDCWTQVSCIVLEKKGDSRISLKSSLSYEGKSNAVAETVGFNWIFHRKLHSRLASGEH